MDTARENLHMKSFSLTKYETRPKVETYPPATANDFDVSLISRDTMLN